jgi:hypothetical protein
MCAPSGLKVIGWSDTWLHVARFNKRTGKTEGESYYNWANIISFGCDDDEQ